MDLSLKNVIIVVFVLVVVFYFLRILFPFNKIKFFGISKKELKSKIEEDFEKMQIYIKGIEEIMSRIDQRRGLFDIFSIKDLNRDKKEELIQLWSKYLDYQIALQMLTDDYRYFYQINYVTSKKLHAKAFLISYASYLSSYKNGMKLITYSINNKILETLLDSQFLEYGVPKGMYSKLKWNVIHVNDVVRLTSGYGYFKYLYKTYEILGLTVSYKDLFKEIEDSYRFSTKNLKKEYVNWLPINALKTFKEKTYTIWFPIQKNIAKGMGKIRFTLRKEALIARKQIIKMKKIMEPGDLVVRRHNWKMTNIGIPGFWPHAAIYIGTIKEANAYFNVPEVQEYIQKKGFTDLKAYLNSISEEFFKDYSRNKFDIYEVITPGVVLTPLTECARADYVAVMRPRLSKLKKFQALTYSIKHYKKGYDYNFNFITDSEMICSELVYKTYKPYLNLDLFSYGGRPIASPTSLVKKFDQEHDTDKQELDFVYFIEGDEKTKDAKIKDVEALRATWRRPKWYILQK